MFIVHQAMRLLHTMFIKNLAKTADLKAFEVHLTRKPSFYHQMLEFRDVRKSWAERKCSLGLRKFWRNARGVLFKRVMMRMKRMKRKMRRRRRGDLANSKWKTGVS